MQVAQIEAAPSAGQQHPLCHLVGRVFYLQRGLLPPNLVGAPGRLHLCFLYNTEKPSKTMKGL
jgi:hypothetical protein